MFSLIPKEVAAFGEVTAFTVERLRYSGGEWDNRPYALPRLLNQVSQRTSIEVNTECPVVDMDDSSLFRSPFAVACGNGEFPPWSEAARQQLSRYLRSGGTLLFDTQENGEQSGFYQAVRRELEAVLPGSPLVRVPRDHVIYKSFYLIDEPVGRTATRSYFEGIEQDGRLCVIYSHNDLLGAWSRDSFGNWMYDIQPGGERQREIAFRVGVNMVMYVLCLDYKSDQVHIPFILERRQWRVE
jgi:hypothetical protein